MGVQESDFTPRIESLPRTDRRVDCQVHQDDVIVPHEADPILAVQHHGETTADNLAWACYHCNRVKGTTFASLDPESGELVHRYHPRQDRWTEHFALDGPRLVGLTSRGRATVSLLRLNSADRVRRRQRLQRCGRYPQSC